MVGIPNGLLFPLALGMYTRLTGCGSKVLAVAVLSDVPSTLCGAPVTLQGRFRFTCSPAFRTISGCAFWSYSRPRERRFRCVWLTYQARSVRGRFTRRTMPASVNSPWYSSAKHRTLKGLLPSHGAFQGHAAHPTGGPAELRPKGSWDACKSQGISAFLSCAFTAHRDVAIGSSHVVGSFLGSAAATSIVSASTAPRMPGSRPSPASADLILGRNLSKSVEIVNALSQLCLQPFDTA